MVELAFVRPPAEPPAWAEIVAALHDELTSLGVSASVHSPGVLGPKEGRVPVVIAPEVATSPPAVGGAVLLTGVPVASPAFERIVTLAIEGGAAAVFDLHATSARIMARRGIAAHHLQLGHTARWDAFADNGRDTDVVFVGRESPRRARALAGFAETFWPYRTRLLLEEARSPTLRSLDAYVGGDERTSLLRRSRVLLNVHEGASDAMEWHRFATAALAGCVVVSEHAGDIGPLVPGVDYLSGRVQTLALLARTLLGDEPRRAAMARSAYERLREHAPLRAAAERLAQVAASARPGPAGFADLAGPPPAFHPPKPADPAVAQVRQGIKNVRLEQIETRRLLQRMLLERDHAGPLPQLEIVHRSPGWSVARPRVSVIVPVFDHAEHVQAALTAVSSGTFHDLEFVVVDDGSRDDSGEQARRWSAERPSVPLLLLRHPVNRGLPYARNTALSCARGELIFPMDADNEALPTALERLVGALDAAPAAAFAYGILAVVGPDGPSHLLSEWRWEPQRLRRGNYIDAMALIRARDLRAAGGYTTDRRLHGWEDFALWCTFAEARETAAFVPEVLAHYRHGEESMLSLTNLAFADAFRALVKRAPALMRDLEVPA